MGEPSFTVDRFGPVYRAVGVDGDGAFVFVREFPAPREEGASLFVEWDPEGSGAAEDAGGKR